MGKMEKTEWTICSKWPVEGGCRVVVTSENRRYLIDAVLNVQDVAELAEQLAGSRFSSSEILEYLNSRCTDACM